MYKAWGAAQVEGVFHSNEAQGKWSRTEKSRNHSIEASPYIVEFVADYLCITGIVVSASDCPLQRPEQGVVHLDQRERLTLAHTEPTPGYALWSPKVADNSTLQHWKPEAPPGPLIAALEPGSQNASNTSLLLCAAISQKQKLPPVSKTPFSSI